MVSFLFSLLFASPVLFLPVWHSVQKKQTLRDFYFAHRRELILFVILLAGFWVRLWRITATPAGFNQDEASIGYDAWSILNYGIDRNGVFMPVHLVAWGSGQNAAYAYLAMPFIKLLGLSVYSVRLPMALLGCASLWAVAGIGRMALKPSFTLALTALTAAAPWHIMKSRWALESNLFPDLILIAVLCLCAFLLQKRQWGLYLGFFLMGLSAYAYGTSYFFLPFFALPLLVWMLWRKKAKLWQAVLAGVILFVTVLPILLFVIINTFGLPEIATPLFTIPKLNESRHTELASVFSGSGFLSQSMANFWGALKMFFLQTDGLPWNSLPFFGFCYVFSIPFTLYGLVSSFFRKEEKLPGSILFHFWFFAAFLMMFVVQPNINRLNIIVFPMIYYTAVGVWRAFRHAKAIGFAAAAAYVLSFSIFCTVYFGQTYEKEMKRDFYASFGQALLCANERNAQQVYVTEHVGAAYVYTLFYTKENPAEYLKTVNYRNPGAAFEHVDRYGRFTFVLPEELPKDASVCAILAAEELGAYELTGFHIEKFERYAVVQYAG